MIDVSSIVLRPESDIIKELLPLIKLTNAEHQLVGLNAKDLITGIRANKKFSIEEFLQRFSLSTEEGVALMCLAEGLLRIPDSYTAKHLILDKLSNKTWGNFLFKRTKSFRTTLASFGLYFAGTYTDIIKNQNVLTNLLDKLGTTIFLKAIESAILFLSKEFVFAEDMQEAVDKLSNYADYRFSFDLLGESSRTNSQAEIYYKQYLRAINEISSAFSDDNNVRERPNLSVKLTALHPRFELSNFAELEKELMPKIVALVKKIEENNLTITFDAEESTRLDCYILFLSQLIARKEFKNFSGIGLVIQGYQTRSYKILGEVIKLAKKLNKIIPVRLVKGAYWDSEIKHAQEVGMTYYPVFTKKAYTDANYIACAKLMLDNIDHIYPQFATHNALTVAYIKELAGNKTFEFQKLFGMGNALHEQLIGQHNVRIYAPVGSTNDLLAYLMRRLLENGANSSFVNQVANRDFSVDKLAFDLHDKVINLIDSGKEINLPENIYPKRKNAMGYDLGYKSNYDYLQEKVKSFFSNSYTAGSIINGKESYSQRHAKDCFTPAKNAEKISSISYVFEKEIKEAISYADAEFEKWTNKTVEERANILRRIADLYEQNKFQLYALLIQEGGKSIQDAINEVIEAIDFCRYYASQANQIMQERVMPGPTGEKNLLTLHGRGVYLCISPWNFPLAIFTGQIVGALVSGNTVIAKPADQTSVIANYAVKLMHKAGIPKEALHLLLASGSNIGEYAVSDERIAGVAFTGSTKTAQLINLTLAQRQNGIVPFIAETGGQNAMIVDSSALIEQVTDDVIRSAFQSAGQRCSALRMLYVQEEIYDQLLSMIKEAMELQKIGDTADFSNDIGPVIDKASFEALSSYIADMKKQNFVVTDHPRKDSLRDGHYFYPHIIEVNSINDIPDEKFGPILHIAKYKAKNLDKVIDEINSYGFGLTFGVHSRIEERIAYIRSKIKAGNIYANRSIIGAKVESQPFGGEKKSGTGFKAGGPHYLLRFLLERTTSINVTAMGGNVELLRDQQN